MRGAARKLLVRRPLNNLRSLLPARPDRMRRGPTRRGSQYLPQTSRLGAAIEIIRDTRVEQVEDRRSNVDNPCALQLDAASYHRSFRKKNPIISMRARFPREKRQMLRSVRVDLLDPLEPF